MVRRLNGPIDQASCATFHAKGRAPSKVKRLNVLFIGPPLYDMCLLNGECEVGQGSEWRVRRVGESRATLR